METTYTNRLYPAVAASLEAARQGFNITQSPRQAGLERLAAFLKDRQANDLPIKVIVICTHNSRRSHLGQFWLTAAASRAVVALEAFSGGTEATACQPNTLAALERAGARVEKMSEGANPHYQLRYGQAETDMLEVFSKVYSHKANPQADFVALMVCSEADQGCPWVEGAVGRYSLPYRDPKYADGTPDEAAAYDEASRTIASEMAWLIDQLQTTTQQA